MPGPDLSPNRPLRAGFLLMPRFPLLASSSVSVLFDGANYCAKTTLFEISTFTARDAVTTSHCGTLIQPTRKLADKVKLDYLFVCSGTRPWEDCSPEVLAFVRRHKRNGATVGGLSSGSYVLGAAGLLSGRRVTVHWENATEFAIAFPHVHMTNTLFEIDDGVVSSSGGAASIDLAIALITESCGRRLADEVAEEFQLGRIRTPKEEQHSLERYAQVHSSWVVVEALRHLRSKISPTISPSKLAMVIGISQRQLERAFKESLGKTPQQHIIELRLKHANELLTTTTMTVADIARASGFGSRSNFHQAYKAHFKKTPREDRLRT